MKDTTLLTELYRQLATDLEAKGRRGWVEEECELLSRVRVAERGDEPLFLRFKGASRMDGRTLAVLEELLVFRDGRARQADVPPFKVLGTDTVRELAERRPRLAEELQGITGLTDKVAARHGEGILRAVERGCAVPAQQLPAYPREERRKMERGEEERLKRLKEWRAEQAGRLGIEPGYIANNALLELVAVNAPRTMGDLEALTPMRCWQRSEFGEQILSAVVPRR